MPTATVEKKPNCGNGRGGFARGNTCARRSDKPKEGPAKPDRLAKLQKAASSATGRHEALAKLGAPPSIYHKALDRAIALKRAAHAERQGKAEVLRTARAKIVAGFKAMKARQVAEKGNAPASPVPPTDPSAVEAVRRLDYDAATVAMMPEGLGKRLAQHAIDDRRAKLGAMTPATAQPAPPAPAPPSAPARDALSRQKIAKRFRAARDRISKADVGSMKTGDIHFDPQRFQYKIEQTDRKTGSVGSLAGVRAWNPDLAGTIQTWKDPESGKTFVVNGHNRLAKAKELGVKDINVRRLKANNAAEARTIGAMTNIAEGRGTSVDAAKFFRDLSASSGQQVGREHLEKHGIPMREKTVEEGLSLSRLADPLFSKVINQTLNPARAAIIGGSGLTHEQQMGLDRLIEERGRKGELNDRDLHEYLDNAKAAGSVKSGTANLFGDDEDEIALGEHRARLQGHIKNRLATERNLFGRVGQERNAKKLAKGGNTIDVGKNAQIAQDAAQALDVFDRLKNTAGPISKHLNSGAERIARGEHPEGVRDEVFQSILGSLGEAQRF